MKITFFKIIIITVEMSAGGDIEDIAALKGVNEEVEKEKESVATAAEIEANRETKVYVKTWGCQHNFSDGEYMAGILSEQGYTIVNSEADADVVIVNGCTAKAPSHDQFISLINRCAKDTGKIVIAAGCAAQTDAKALDPSVGVVGVNQIHRIGTIVSSMVQSRRSAIKSDKELEKEPETTTAAAMAAAAPRALERGSGLPPLSLPKRRENPLIESLAACAGCLDHCAYCKTKYARGGLRSFKLEDVVAQVRRCVSEGVREVRLTGEDIGAYGVDIGTDLPALLDEIVKVLEGTETMLRIGMANPPYILRHMDALARILAHPNVFSWLHVPVQAGSDHVLRAMNRRYSVEEFEKAVTGLRERVPGIEISTDVICGFPTETDEDFAGTLGLIEKYRFSFVNINAMFVRPGTPAAKMERVPGKVVKARAAEMHNLFHSYQTFDHMVGKRYKVWITERAHDGKSWAAHTKCYVQVLLSGDDDRITAGSTAMIEVTEASKWSVRGKLVEN